MTPITGENEHLFEMFDRQHLNYAYVILNDENMKLTHDLVFFFFFLNRLTLHLLPSQSSECLYEICRKMVSYVHRNHLGKQQQSYFITLLARHL